MGKIGTKIASDNLYLSVPIAIIGTKTWPVRCGGGMETASVSCETEVQPTAAGGEFTCQEFDT